MVRRDPDRDDALSEVENMLNDLMIGSSMSKTQLKDHVKKQGICLYNGVSYGRGLKKEMKTDGNKIVKLEEVKRFPLSKMCLVKL